MTKQPTCPECQRAIAPEDTVSFDGSRLTHLDCGRPRTLTPEERLLLATYCWEHTVAGCTACAREYRLPEVISAIVDGDTHYCPFCRRDMIDDVRVHLYGCEMLPDSVRGRARAARQAARELVKRSHELRDAADVLMRQSEVAIGALREAMRLNPHSNRERER